LKLEQILDFYVVTTNNLIPLPLVSHLLFNFLLLPHNFDVPVFPVRLSQLDRPAAHVLPVQLFHSSREIRRVFEADEAEAFGLVALLVADDLCANKGRVSAEGSDENLVGHVVAEVTCEQPEVVRVPLFQRLVLPNLKNGNSVVMPLILFIILLKLISNVLFLI
jgi:hypothetical protein